MPGAGEQEGQGDYEYDLFISYRRVKEWQGTVKLVQDILVEHLNSQIAHQNGRIRCFKDDETIKGGNEWERRIVNGLTRSKVLIPIVWNQYFEVESAWCRDEYGTMRARQEHLRPGGGEAPSIIVPIAIYDPVDKQRFNPLQCEDVSKHVINGMTNHGELRDQLWLALREIAKPIGQLILEPPAFDPDWAGLKPLDVRPIFNARPSTQADLLGFAS